MNSELSANAAIAYCAVRRNGKIQRVSVAAPVRGGHLLLRTCDKAALAAPFGASALGAVDPISIIEALPLPGVRVLPSQQFTMPLYRPPVASEPTSTSSISLANLHELRGRLACHTDDHGKWSTGGQLIQLAAPPFGLTYVWAQEAITGVWWPTAVPKVVAEAVSALCGESDVTHISDSVRQVISDICSVPPFDPEPNSGTPRMIDLRVPWMQLSSLVSYYAQVRESGAMRLGDRDSAHRAWMNDERVSRMLLVLYAPYLSRLLGRTLSPHFSHFVSYLPYSSLPGHLDKDPSVYSVSVQLGYSDHGVAARNSWSFSVQDCETETVRDFTPQTGSGVVFRGGTERHSRVQIPEGHISDVLLLHYLSEVAH